MKGFHSGIMLLPTPQMAPDSRPIGALPTRACARETRLRKGGTAAAMAPKWRAMKAATIAPAGGLGGAGKSTPPSRASCRRVLMNSPVLILTGHFSWHMPSAAHVCSAYSQLASNARSRSDLCTSPLALNSSRMRLISLKTWIRWRGVSDRSRDGQLDSHQPHEMQRSMSGWMGWSKRIFLAWTSGSSLSTTPGLSRKWGSKSFLTSHMSAYALVPHSISTNGATLRPVPCSALSEPPYLRATFSQMSYIRPSYRRSSASFWKD
mmetsp:Transcript_20938/g.55064  ORF Transcript_20938/g.55064 Transcript_20938/m.55064 type:complete len:264 (+) Transcript_20938:963-1754(+)